MAMYYSAILFQIINGNVYLDQFDTYFGGWRPEYNFIMLLEPHSTIIWHM